MFSERGLLIKIEESNNDLIQSEEEEPRGNQEPICQVPVSVRYPFHDHDALLVDRCRTNRLIRFEEQASLNRLRSKRFLLLQVMLNWRIYLSLEETSCLRQTLQSRRHLASNSS
jgi:hypothetical protein